MSDIVERLRFGYLPTPIGNKIANDDALEAANEIERLRAALKDTLDHCDERDSYWNKVAYKKRQAGKDDTSACARAAEAARIAEFFRGRFVAHNETSPKGLCPGGCGMPPHVCVCEGGDRDSSFPSDANWTDGCGTCAKCGLITCTGKKFGREGVHCPEYKSRPTDCDPKSCDGCPICAPATEDEGTGQ